MKHVNRVFKVVAQYIIVKQITAFMVASRENYVINVQCAGKNEKKQVIFWRIIFYFSINFV